MTSAAPRLAIIGTGNIAEFHVPAFHEAGFQVRHVASRPGSTRLHPFAAKHKIPDVHEDVDGLLDASDDWDALLIAAPIEDTPGLLKRALRARKPTLVEKPVALRSRDLAPFGRAKNVLVAYNRRFYASTEAARAEAILGPLLATLTLPEGVTAPAADKPGRYLRPFFGNSVHGIDLARHVLGDLRLLRAERLRDDRGHLRGVAALLKSKPGHLLHFQGNWGAPANFGLILDRPGRRLEMRPLEEARVYEGMDVIEPTPVQPLRSYRPRLSRTIPLTPDDQRFKPGFVAQARALHRLVKGEDAAPAATLADARATLALAERLVGTQYAG